MNDITAALITIFQGFRKPWKPEDDEFDSVGRTVLAKQIDAFVLDGRPVQFVLSAFPAKSPNHTVKTLGFLPDGAEEVALRNFDRFAKRIREVYAPGVSIRVITDGYVFQDIIGLSEEDVRRYHKRCVEMATGTPIEVMTLLDFFPQGTSIETALVAMLEECGQTDEEIKERIRTCKDTEILYCGLHRFMQTDIAWPAGMSANQIKKQAKPIAKKLLMRSEAYSRFITHHYPDAVRLSCHPSTNAGRKYSWQFIPGNLGWNTPWHNVLVVIDGTYTLMKRSEAEERGFELVFKNGQPYYFRDRPSAADLV